MLKYVIKNIKIDGEVLDLYARAEAEDVTYYIPKETGGYESKSLQTVLSQVEADIKKLKKDIEQIEIGGSTIIQPIEYGGTGADNVVDANQNLSSAFLGSVPWGIESFSVISPDNIDYSLPDGTYRFNGGVNDFPTVTINIQPVDAYSGEALTTAPWEFTVPAYSIVEIFHTDSSGAALLSSALDDVNDLGYYYAFLYPLEVDNIVENYAVQEGMQVYAFVYGDSATVELPMEKLDSVTYTVSWYAETSAGSGEYTLTDIKSPNPEIRGGDGFGINTTVSVTDDDKVLNSDYTFDESNTNNVLSMTLTADESTNALKLYFNKLPDPVYTSYTIKMFDADSGEELEGAFSSETNNGGFLFDFPQTISDIEVGTTITYTVQSILFSNTTVDGETVSIPHEYVTSDERNVTTIMLVEDATQNVIKVYYRVPPVATTYTIKYTTDLGTLVPTILLNPNTITKDGFVGDTVSLTTEEATKKVNGFLPRYVSDPITLVKDPAQNVLIVNYPVSSVEREVTIHYVIKEVEDIELTGEYDRVVYNAENDTISKIDTVTLPWTRRSIIGDTLPISVFSYTFTQNNITLYVLDTDDISNPEEWTVPVTGDLTLYYKVTTVINLPEVVSIEPEAYAMILEEESLISEPVTYAAALNMELDTNDNLILPRAPDSPSASVPSDDTGIISADLRYGKLFVMSQQSTNEANNMLGIHLFVGKINPGNGIEKDAILFRCFDKHDYVGNPMDIPWTSLSDSGIDEVTPDIINGIIPISKGGTGVSDVTGIGNALKVPTLAGMSEQTFDLNTIKEPGTYNCTSSSTNKPGNRSGILIVAHDFPGSGQPKQFFIEFGYQDVSVYFRAWVNEFISGSDGTTSSFEGYKPWHLISMPDTIPKSKFGVDSIPDSAIDGPISTNNGGTGASAWYDAAKNLRVQSLDPQMVWDVDLNTYTSVSHIGTYRCKVGRVTNAPSGIATNSYFVLVVSTYGDNGVANTQTAQTIYEYNGTIWYRYQPTATTWSNWSRLVFDNLDNLRTAMNITAHGLPSYESNPINFNLLDCGTSISNVFLQGVQQKPYNTPLGSTDVVSYYNVDTFGIGTRKTQIASLPFAHQQGMYARFLHDSTWSPWYTMFASNENLLINWDFTNPVDQRGNLGKTIAKNESPFFIDRWKFMNQNNSTATVSVSRFSVGKALTFTMSGKNYEHIKQDLHFNAYDLINTQLTFSAFFIHSNMNSIKSMLSDVYLEITVGDINGTNYVVGQTFLSDESNIRFVDNRYGLARVTITVPIINISTFHVSCRIVRYSSSTGTKSIHIVATKLEKGPVSTLMMDPLGVNYEKEYQKCLRYYFEVRNSGSFEYVHLASNAHFWDPYNRSLFLVYDLPVPMRTTPVITYSGLKLQDYLGNYLPCAVQHSIDYTVTTKWKDIPKLSLHVYGTASGSIPDAHRNASQLWCLSGSNSYIAFNAEY